MEGRIAGLISRLNKMDPKVLAAAGMTAGRIRSIALRLPKATQIEIDEIAVLLERAVNSDFIKRGSSEFLMFVRAVYPNFIEGGHIRQIAKEFEEIAAGRRKRLLINIAPRHGKSELSSFLFPAWYIGKFPSRKIMLATHTSDLATSFGRKIRNLMATDIYQSIFPGVTLAEDSKSQGKWHTSAMGEFFAAGVGTNIAGRGADLFIGDDLASEQDAREGEHNPAIWEKIWQWYLQGPRQRLQPNAAMLQIGTRWNLSDPTGKLLENQKRGGEQWHVIRFPAILPSGRVLWPEFWSLKEMENLRDELDPVHWFSQYMQDPTADVAAIISRASWMPWEGELPDIAFTATFVDTAHTAEKTSNWSAWTTWGAFKHPDDGRDCMIMLEARKERLEYPDLKLEMVKHNLEMRPDLIQIETKSSGAPLLQELRRMRMPVMGFTPTKREGNKIRRLMQVSDLWRNGRVFYPDRTWAREVIQEVAEFPRGMYDDFVDTCSMAGAFMREGNFVRTDIEEQPEDEAVAQQMEAYY